MAHEFTLSFDWGGRVKTSSGAAPPVGCRVEDAFDAGGRAKFRAFLDAIREHGHAAGWELNLACPQGPVPVRCHGLRTESGVQIVGEAAAGGDEATVRLVNQLTCAERDLMRQNEWLREQNAELRQFAARVAHDLKAPLRNVHHLLHLLAGAAPPDSPGAVWVSRAQADAGRMSAMIASLLELSRAESGSLRLETVDLEAAVRRASGGDARVECDSLPAVQADPGLVECLLQNLIENAFTHGRSETLKVQIGAVRSGRFWQVTVRDNGPGIPAADQRRIFEMFERGSASTGSGIGLATCRRIVARHGGEIWVESEPGAGCAFHFTLPARGPNRCTIADLTRVDHG